MRRSSTHPRHRVVPAAAGLIWCVITGCALGAPPDVPARVLVLSECQPRQPICRDAATAIEETFSSPTTVAVELYFEYLDTSRLGPVRDAALLARQLSAKYADRPPTLILAYSDQAASVLVEQRAALWPNAPIVAFALERAHPDFPPDVAQLKRPQIDYRMADTVAAALRMVAGARSVTYVGGTGPADLRGLAVFREQVRQELPSVPIVELTGLTMADTLDRVSRLPSDTVVYTFGIFIDGTGQRFVPNEAVRAISTRANRPVFALAASSIGTGIVGGYLTDFGAEARAAAHVAARLLAGERLAGSQSVPRVTPLPLVDWRQLRRWNIREADLPAGSIVRYREPSFLERYWWWLAIAVLQTGFIAGLLIERRARRSASRAAAASESLNRSVIASLPGMIAIVDQAGVVLKTNQAWAEQGPPGLGLPPGAVRPGDNCRALCLAAHPDDPLASRVLRAVTDVLEHRAPEAILEYSSEMSGESRWFKLQVQALDRAEGGAVVTFTDITQRKLAEFEGRRTLQQAARAARVTTMGELAASLAHEINQPLAAVLANAQAASRMLAAPTPNLELVRETIEDIVKNDRRAGEIIRRMRGLLQKGEAERVPVSLNDIGRDVLALLAPEASLRRVTLESLFAPDLPAISGDAIQLQQVVTNLVMNALDAVSDGTAGQRFVLVSTRADERLVELTVRDRGAGIDASTLPNIFNPFFTTKRTGLGMGLSISRSIVEAHGGRIAAENNPEGGASFTCRFPAAEETAA